MIRASEIKSVNEAKMINSAESSYICKIVSDEIRRQVNIGEYSARFEESANIDIDEWLRQSECYIRHMGYDIVYSIECGYKYYTIIYWR